MITVFPSSLSKFIPVKSSEIYRLVSRGKILVNLKVQFKDNFGKLLVEESSEGITSNDEWLG